MLNFVKSGLGLVLIAASISIGSLASAECQPRENGTNCGSPNSIPHEDGTNSVARTAHGCHIYESGQMKCDPGCIYHENGQVTCGDGDSDSDDTWTKSSDLYQSSTRD
jgi:hypothetical protein